MLFHFKFFIRIFKYLLFICIGFEKTEDISVGVNNILLVPTLKMNIVLSKEIRSRKAQEFVFFYFKKLFSSRYYGRRS